MLLSLSRTRRENEQLLITCEINEFDSGYDGDGGSKKWECVTRLFTGRENVATWGEDISVTVKQLNSSIGSAHVMSVSSQIRMQFHGACLHSTAQH